MSQVFKPSNSIKNLLRLAKEEQINLNNLAAKISVRQEAIEKVVHLLESSPFDNSIDLSSITGDLPTTGDLVDDKNTFQNYPQHGTKQEKVSYILGKADKALRISEMQDDILKAEGPIKGKKTLKSFNHILKAMVASKSLLVGRVANSKRHVFYVLPKFLYNDGKLKPKHFPETRSWGKLPESKRNEITDCFK